MEQNSFVIEMILKQWNNKVKQTTDKFGTLGAQHTAAAVAPGKNSVTYLLGHFIAVHDRIMEALKLGERKYPEYDALFLQAEKPENKYPEYALLLQQWIDLNEELSAKIAQLKPEDWLTKHHYVSAEDFKLDTGRNKLNIILSRLGHLFHHGGQLSLVS